MLTIPYGIGEKGDPFTEDEEARFTAEHEVKLDVAMSEDEVVDFGVALEVVFGKEDKPLLVFSLVGLFSIVGGTFIAYQFGVVHEAVFGHHTSILVWQKAAIRTFHARVLCPIKPEVHEPMGMNPSCHLLQGLVAEAPEHEVRGFALLVETVAMSEIEYLSSYVEGARLAMKNDTALFLKVVLHPHVMIAREVMHLHT